jgi:hypothetical protein
MAGLNTLHSIYQKKGEQFIQKLFSLNVIVTEKIQGVRFCFEKRDGNFTFFKKDSSEPIDKVDRIVMTLYEYPITYIENLPSDVQEAIPEKVRFGFTYIPSKDFSKIVYDRLPKNKLILTDIVKDGKFISEYSILNEYADLLYVSKPPVIFSGKLSSSQKDKIIQYVIKNTGDSLVEFVINTLNPNAKFYVNGVDRPIDSIVFRFEGDSEDYLAKIVDPLFYELMKNNDAVNNNLTPSDIYHLAVNDIFSHLSVVNIGSILASSDGKTYSEVYIDFVFNFFKDFIKHYGEDYKKVDFDKPSFLGKRFFDLNTIYIDDEEVISIIENVESHRELLKIMLNSLQKLRKNTNRFMDDSLLKNQNELVKGLKIAIENKLSLPDVQELVYENYFSDMLLPIKDLSPDDEDAVSDLEKTTLLKDLCVLNGIGELTDEIRQSVPEGCRFIRINESIGDCENFRDVTFLEAIAKIPSSVVYIPANSPYRIYVGKLGCDIRVFNI